MKMLTARTRIAFGMVCLVTSVLCTAMMIGMVPDRDTAVVQGRKAMCEVIAMSSSDYISRGELRRLEHMLTEVVQREEQLLSAGVRKSNGDLVATIGEHMVLWEGALETESTPTHVQVPIQSGRSRWGKVELRFTAVRQAGVLGWLLSPWLHLTTFVSVASFLLFQVYLRKMLSHLDPSQAVPNRVRSALDSLAEGLLVIDRKQRIVLANQSFADWIGRNPEKLIGVGANTLGWVKDEHCEPLDAYPWVEAIEREQPQAGVMLGIKRGDGSVRVVIANASPVLGHDGKYRGVLVSFDDVTQLEETKKDLSVAKQAAEEANQAKSDFLAQMSHEIRTPMNAILGYTDVLRRGFDDTVENRQEYLDTIHGSGEHLLALINDILDLSKVEAGQLELELQRCSPHKLISQVISLLRSKADEKGISLECRFEGLLPETILTDEVRLRQAVMNLAGNAIKFTSEGGVTIVARMVDGTTGDGRSSKQLAIDVADTGIGIPESAQAKVFEPFAQADSSVTRKFGGTGLGLAISKQLAEAMGGGIGLVSEEGKGSTFTVNIDVGPLVNVKLVDGKEALANSSTTTTQKDVIQLPPSRILVADDGEANRKLVELVLGRAGAEVVSVENGKLALEQALETPFDAILMDMQMPVMDGQTATRKLRAEGYELPIIALTAQAMQGDEEQCRAAGCSGFLTKPIKIDLLLSTLSEVLEARTQEARALVESSSPRPTETLEEDVCEEVVELAEDAAQAVSIRETPKDGESGTEPSDAIDGEPIHCSYPLDDPDFLEMAELFTSRLETQLDEMQTAIEHDDDATLAGLAHWVKGSGGTAGFEAFTEPAMELEMAAKSQERDQYQPLVQELRQLAGRIVLTS